jgi:beta-xylosidase
MGKINEDNQNLYKENTNLYNETSNIPKVNNLNLNKFHNTQITISRGKIQIKGKMTKNIIHLIMFIKKHKYVVINFYVKR